MIITIILVLLLLIALYLIFSLALVNRAYEKFQKEIMEGENYDAKFVATVFPFKIDYDVKNVTNKTYATKQDIVEAISNTVGVAEKIN